MRQRGVQRSKARGRGVGRWCRRFGKYADLLSTRKWESCVFGIFPPWDLFSKKCVFRRCVFRIRVDDRPKWCNICAFFAKERSRLKGPLVYGAVHTGENNLFFLRLLRQHLRPYGSTENDWKRCSSYSRPLGGTWNFRIRMDCRPKWCNTCAFSKKNVVVWTGPKSIGKYLVESCSLSLWI